MDVYVGDQITLRCECEGKRIVRDKPVLRPVYAEDYPKNYYGTKQVR